MRRPRARSRRLAGSAGYRDDRRMAGHAPTGDSRRRGDPDQRGVTTMWRFLFIAFLIAHGLVHLAIWLMPKPPGQKAPFDPDHSWLLGDQKTVAVVLAVAAAAVLMAGGAG